MHKRSNMPDLPKLMLGTSPFIGAGQFGSKSLDYRRRFFDNPDNMTGLFVHSASLGVKAAASTHSPGTTIPLLDEMGFEAYLAPVNTVGYGMEPDVESTLKALLQTKKTVIAIKPLAAGKLSPERSVFDYIYRYADSIAVGITSKVEMEKTYSAAIA